jgi:hypothetical protein
MSQIIACKSTTGIVLGADSSAVEFGMDGTVRHRPIQRLHVLTPKAAILAGGASEGEAICRELTAFVKEEKLSSIDDLLPAALSFLSSAYTEFMTKRCEFHPVDPIHHLHFILAGISDTAPADPLRIHLVWTKKKRPQLDSDDVESVYAVPRMVGLEHMLYQKWRENLPASVAMSAVKEAFRRQADVHEEINGPFVFGILSRDGFEDFSG